MQSKYGTESFIYYIIVSQKELHIESTLSWVFRERSIRRIYSSIAAHDPTVCIKLYGILLSLYLQSVTEFQILCGTTWV